MSIASTALAGPPSAPDYGVVDPVGITNLPPQWMSDVDKIIPAPSTPFGQIHIVTDPLMVNWPTDNTTQGWTTFWCQSTVGFQYNIGATGLEARSRYNVHAVGGSVEYSLVEVPGAIPLEPGVWVLPWTAAPVDLDLGQFVSDAGGSGGVKGAVRLTAGRAYEVITVISASGGTPVLSTPADDANGFMVY